MRSIDSLNYANLSVYCTEFHYIIFEKRNDQIEQKGTSHSTEFHYIIFEKRNDQIEQKGTTHIGSIPLEIQLH